MVDRCECKTIYPNGWILLLAQVLGLVAVGMSLGSFLDCKLVRADLGNDVPAELIGLTGGERRGLGLFMHEDDSGDCYWRAFKDDEDDGVVEDYIDAYMDWVGWDGPRARTATAVAFGGALWTWLAVFMCIAHRKPFRWLLGALMIVLVMSLQFSSLAVLDSVFCEGRNCELGRSAHMSIWAGVLYFLTGVLMFCTKDYPGPEPDAPAQASTLPVARDLEDPHDTNKEESQPPEEATHVSIY